MPPARVPIAARSVAIGPFWSTPTANRAAGTSFQPRCPPLLGRPLRDAEKGSIAPHPNGGTGSACWPFSPSQYGWEGSPPRPRRCPALRLVNATDYRTEVEYGIRRRPTRPPTRSSPRLRRCWLTPRPRHSSREAHPLGLRSGIAVARCPRFDLIRSAGRRPVVDADEVGAANMILTNGPGLYVDHAHPNTPRRNARTR